MKHPYRILIAALVALVLPGCETIKRMPITLAYVNDDIAGHTAAASITLGGKNPVATLAFTKTTRGIRAGSGK